jgi:uncharacterized membrane protein
MSRFEHTVTVDAPVREVYNQWTQFESFPSFMDGVEQVVQMDHKTLAWTASIAGQRRRWMAEITDQTPDTRIAWKSISGAENAGAVLFEPADAGSTTVTLRLDVDPDGFVEHVGDKIGAVDRRVKGDLDRFKAFMERRQTATGAWRGEIHGDDVRDPAFAASRGGGDDRA